MKKLALIVTLLISTTAFALPEDFSFSGDVKFAGKHLTKKTKAEEEEKASTGIQEGKGALPETPLEISEAPKVPLGTSPSPAAAWHNEEKGNLEANFMASYKQDLGWAASKITVANDRDKPKLKDTATVKQILVGSDFYERGATRWYGEFGRQPLSDHFESAVQFNRRFDGLYTEISRPVGRLGTYVAQGGGMLVHLKRRSFGWIAMTGFDGIWGTGAYTRISMTSWDSRNQPIQLLAGYRFKEFWILPKGRAYAAYLINPGASSHRQAGYVGTQFGNTQKQGDWSLKIEMRAVGGNTLYKDDATGKNFWGPVSEVGYAFTDNFSARLKLQHSSRLSSKVKGDHSNSQIEGKVILAF